MKKSLKKILAGIGAFAFLSTTPIAVNAYNLNKPELVVQTEKRDLHINFNQDGSKFVYTKLDSNTNPATSEIIVNEKGIEKVLTEGKYFDMEPAFSPDSKKIAFFRNISRGYGIICVMDSDGKNLEAIVPTGITKVSWSPDGKEIAYKDTYVEEKTYVLTEEDIEYLKKTYNTDNIGPKPGDEIKYKDCYAAIALVNIETKEMKYLTTNEGNCKDPEFTADGKILYVFNEDRNTNVGKDILIMDRDGKNKQPIVQPENYERITLNADGSNTFHIKSSTASQVSIDGDLITYLMDKSNMVLRKIPTDNEKGYEIEEIKDEYSIGIYVKNLKTGETKLVTDEGSLWFPEIKNNKVYFSRYDNHETEHDIYSIDLGND